MGFVVRHWVRDADFVSVVMTVVMTDDSDDSDDGGDDGDDGDDGYIYSPLKYSVKDLTWDSSSAIGCVMRTLYLSSPPRYIV